MILAGNRVLSRGVSSRIVQRSIIITTSKHANSRPRSTMKVSGFNETIDNNAKNNNISIDPSLVPGFKKWLDHCNSGQAVLNAHCEQPSNTARFIPFILENQTVGYLEQSFINHLTSFPDVFHNIDGVRVELTPQLQSASMDVRSAAVATAMSALRDKGVISGWRDELYPVMGSFYDTPLLLIERAASPFFGIKAYGVHVNGYVKRSTDGQILLWVARRSAAKPTWPGKLDHIVAGGQPFGLSLAENVIKECQEEAGIPADMASRARPVGAVSYTSLQPSGLKRDVLFCYDLELPENFTPLPVDGEVEEFFLLPLQEVAELIAKGTPDPSDRNAYKDNCNLVVLDFLIRHGVFTPDTPGYLDVFRGLVAGDCR